MPVLKFGSEGAYVYMLQLALSRAGYDAGGLDGIFGAGTQRALSEYQRSFGLEPDGVVGSLTWMSLRRWLTGFTTHRVRQGDTFYKLAMSYGSSIAAISAANPNTDPLKLRVGALLIIPYSFEVVPQEIPFCHALLGFCVEGLAARYPFIRRRTIGRSVMGRGIYALSLGDGEKKLCVNAAHHANEWITVPLVLSFLENYAEAYVSGGRIGGYAAPELYSAAELYIVPMVDPDGADLVTGAVSAEFSPSCYEQTEKIAAEYPNIPFPEGWKANIDGTDLNLQYPAGWEKAKELKYAAGFDKPAPRDFVGVAPLSAPESAAMYRFTNESQFDLTLSYHTQGKVIYWKYQEEEPPKGREIGEVLSRVSGYALDEVPYESGFAGYKDWFISEYDRPAYTIEAGAGTNPLPLSQLSELLRDNIPLLAAAISETGKL